MFTQNQNEIGNVVDASTDNCPTNPHHYSRWKIQPLKFCRDNNIDFMRGNVIKYLLRHEEKNGMEDLAKAYFYFMQHVKLVYGVEGVERINQTIWDVCE